MQRKIVSLASRFPPFHYSVFHGRIIGLVCRLSITLVTVGFLAHVTWHRWVRIRKKVRVDLG